MAKLNWHYPRCFIVDVYDGDTIHVNIDLGQDLWVMNRSVRLAGIAARELREPGGKEARDALRALLPIGTKVSVVSTGWDKYAGRIDGYVYIGEELAQVAQDFLVDNGWAVYWNGKGPQPKPEWPNPKSPIV